MNGGTIPSWRIIVEQEIVAMSRFKQLLGPEDRAVFDDLLSQCKLYTAEGGLLALDDDVLGSVLSSL